MSKKTKDFSLNSWIEDDNAQPWWKTRDIDELAYLVSQKLLSYVENCDLPPPKSSVFSNVNAEAKDTQFCCSYNAICDTEQAFEGDQTKAQLMEALCYSQTRAREAEELAKQAYAEKEHIIALFFIQTSQLFAYKQWCRLLHLESLNSQIKNKHTLVSTVFPESLPWMSSIEGKKPLMRKQKLVNEKQEKLGKLKGEVLTSTTYDVGFALGLSLVGTGLLLGWTVGWMCM